MVSFRYRAMTTAGTVTTGTLDAPSRADAIAEIRKLGHLPLSASQAGAAWRGYLPELPGRAYSAASISFVTQELAALLTARLPLDRALAILLELDETRNLRKPLAEVLASVRDGSSLADAMKASRAFSKSYVTIVRAGEHGGNIEDTLKRLAEYLARASAVRAAIVSAMTYPAVLLVLSSLSVVLILMFVLPEFAPLFAQSTKPIPASTAIALAIGGFLSDYWWLVAMAAALGALLFRRAARTDSVRRWWDRVLLKLPVVGDLALKIQVERFCRMLGTLLANGVALPQSLQLTRDTLTNTVIADAVGATATSLKQGEPLANRLRQTGVFPALSLDLIRVGEETGALSEMLLKQAELYEHEVKHSVDRLLALAVPLMTVAMGMLIAGLIGSILVAILSINDLAT
jgi:general secretion pathway protein F